MAQLVCVCKVRRALVVRWLGAQPEDEVAARFEERGEFAEGPFAFCGRNVHPYPVQQDEVELVIEGVHRLQGREAVVDPLDARRGMMGLGLFAKGVGRLDSDYLVALFGKPGSVAPGAGSNVKDQKLGGW